MKTTMLSIVIACAGVASSCATAPPPELVDAREAYRRASTGPAAKSAPAEVHVAGKALGQAERSFDEESDSYRTRDLAYVAHRRAQLAEATASIKRQQRSQAGARDDFQETQGEIVENTKADLAASERRADAEQTARAAADQRAAAAQAALAKLAAVKEEPRGTVITLSGSVLFASNQATLLPEAQQRLDQVVDALLQSAERRLTIEGHTDSQGSGSHNLDLSQRRAAAVRDYIVQRGYEADLVEARGIGEDRPVAGNRNAEGRANNRRVEIIIERDAHTSNP